MDKNLTLLLNYFMKPFNHYAYSAVGDWVYRVMAGLYEDARLQEVKIMPHIGKGITSAKADMETFYGRVSSALQLRNNQLVLSVEAPANTKPVYVSLQKILKRLQKAVKGYLQTNI